MLSEISNPQRKFPVWVTEISCAGGNLQPRAEISGLGWIFPTRATKISDGTVDTQNWHKSRFAGQSGRTGHTDRVNWSDRSRQLCQIVNWTSPLRISRRDNRNAYIERLIRTPDEEVMPPGRPAPRSDRSDWSRGGQTGPKSPIRVRSCILMRDL